MVTLPCWEQKTKSYLGEEPLTNHPEGNTVGGSLQNGLSDSDLRVCTPFIIPTCCVWAALSDSFLLKAMRWTWWCDWETRSEKAV